MDDLMAFCEEYVSLQGKELRVIEDIPIDQISGGKTVAYSGGTLLLDESDTKIVKLYVVDSN